MRDISVIQYITYGHFYFRFPAMRSIGLVEVELSIIPVPGFCVSALVCELRGKELTGNRKRDFACQCDLGKNFMKRVFSQVYFIPVLLSIIKPIVISDGKAFAEKNCL